MPKEGSLKSKPRIALFANGIRGYELAQIIFEYGYPIEFLATWHKDNSEYEEKIAALCTEHGITCHRKMDANSEKFVLVLKASDIDIVLMLWLPTIIKKDAIEAVNIGWINQHTGYLPHNQGMHPWYWTIIDGNKFGITLHFVNEGIDSGDILFQSEIPVNITDTGETLYQKMLDCLLRLYKESYPKITRLEFTRVPQPKEEATFHWARELDEHSRIELDRSYRASDLINILRARTFWNGPSAYFFKDGKKYHIRVDIKEAE